MRINVLKRIFSKEVESVVKVLVLPDNEIVEISKEKIRVKDIIEHIGETNPDYVTVLVNDSLVKDVETEVSSSDRIVVIKQPTGG
uniref:MoaD/ThiS family protein n=1 Tax=Staphylothermus marinus TaxID=2280 RepID=A0A7C4JMJ0_STAMA